MWLKFEVISRVHDFWSLIICLHNQALPTNVPTSFKQRAALVDEIWHAAGDDGSALDWYVKRTVLGGIYSTTEVYMLTDKSPGLFILMICYVRSQMCILNATLFCFSWEGLAFKFYIALITFDFRGWGIKWGTAESVVICNCHFDVLKVKWCKILLRAMSLVFYLTLWS